MTIRAFAVKMLAFSLFLASASAVNADGVVSTELSEAKNQKWQRIQKMLRDQKDVCLEHCGADQACEDRCEKAMKSRLEKEYQKLIHEE